ncbi:Uncharacterised protein [Serratia proteamaculans]|nr:Uncharacterised protein [Serratia proteamaculans]CAI1114142.1 Uncharacterised protein [Serratia proteamaculans]CAI1211219.1 Uncharacterised protein [Serratia proteamaculans]CAI1612746.1 Uncharacterised protein [Serratia proteamaculans]
MINVFVCKRVLTPTSLCLLVMLLSGCKIPPRSAIPPAVSNAAVAQQAEAEAQRLRQCQQELDTLRDLKADSYAATQHTFSTLMQGAAQYAKLRTQVNTDTQETVDALYRYRVNVLCAQINQAVLVGLMTQGEAPK